MFNWLKNLLGLGEPSGKRARNAKGRYVADNPDTPDVNEAYVDGKTPKRKPAKKVAPKKRGRPRKTQAQKK